MLGIHRQCCIARARNICITNCTGIFTVSAKQVKSKEFLEFEKAWYSQPSTASMSANGIRSDCSDAVDATGRYIWREDGKKEGRCCGIDFEQAGEKWRAKKCSHGNSLCATAAITPYVPFTYDAAIALAHGLDKLVHNRSAKITADLLSEAIIKSSFEGVSGHVSFLSNGDRKCNDIEFLVYNYHATASSGRFEAVGQIVNDGFTLECDGGSCPPIFFSDGNTKIPAVRIIDLFYKQCVYIVCMPFCYFITFCNKLQQICNGLLTSSW